MDRNVRTLVESFVKRAEHGRKKYGVTTERTDLNLRDWLQHTLEEAMDTCVYLTRAIYEIDVLHSRQVEACEKSSTPNDSNKSTT